jgi:hypothetical protein
MLRYEFIGWNRDEEENHDKVWGVICIDAPANTWANGKYVSFWGRRGKKLSTKIYELPPYEMRKVWDKKHNGGYTKIDVNRLATVYPEFQADLEKTAVWAILSN